MKTAPFSVGAPRGAPVHEIGFTSILHISGGLKTTNAEKSTSQTAFGGQLSYKESLSSNIKSQASNIKDKENMSDNKKLYKTFLFFI